LLGNYRLLQTEDGYSTDQTLAKPTPTPYTVWMNSIKAPPNNEAQQLFTSKVECGFPSPAEDHMDLSLNLNEYLIKHPAATFFVRAAGQSMRDAGILAGDLLVVDRSLTPKDNSIVIAIVDNELTVKRLKIIQQKAFLYPANKNYKPIAVSETVGLELWGVVTYAIHDVCSS
jgi:DNA polymerase V